MFESPVLGGCFVVNIGDADAVVLYLTKSVKVELADKRREVIVFEVLRDDVGGEYVGVFDKEGETIFSPADVKESR